MVYLIRINKILLNKFKNFRSNFNNLIKILKQNKNNYKKWKILNNKTNIC